MKNPETRSVVAKRPPRPAASPALNIASAADANHHQPRKSVFPAALRARDSVAHGQPTRSVVPTTTSGRPMSESKDALTAASATPMAATLSAAARRDRRKTEGIMDRSVQGLALRGRQLGGLKS